MPALLPVSKNLRSPLWVKLRITRPSVTYYVTGYKGFCVKNDYVVMVGGARDGSRLARVLYPRLSEHELIEALKHLVRAIRDRNPNQLPAGDYLDQTPDTELKAS